MSLKLQESLSSFVDNELDASACDELLAHVDENETSKKRLTRYAIISRAIKRDLPKNVNHNLLAGVQAGIAADLFSENKSKVVAFPPKTSDDLSFRPVVGFGIAATFTLVAVLGFQMFTNTNDLPQKAIIASHVPATQQIQIVAPLSAVVVTNVVSVVDELPSVSGSTTYAEQSLINDGQWTRITRVGDTPLQRPIFSGAAENYGQYKNFPFARSVSLESPPFK